MTPRGVVQERDKTMEIFFDIACAFRTHVFVRSYDLLKNNRCCVLFTKFVCTFLVKKILKLDFIVLFKYLKIILLKYF